MQRKLPNTPLRSEDEAHMLLALKEAEKAAKNGEVPVGAVIVMNGTIIAKGANARERKNDPTAHAEVIAIRKAAKKLGSWRLGCSTIYVTLEPCLMCMGAILQSRIDRLVFATRDVKAGACGSVYDISDDARLNHRVKAETGVLTDEARIMLSKFFLTLRERDEKRKISKKLKTNA